MCGNIVCKWLYPIERYLMMLKQYVRNKLLLREHGKGLCNGGSRRTMHGVPTKLLVH